MSRASDLRDAIAEAIASEGISFDGEPVPVDTVVIPDYEREALTKPRIVVMQNSRQVDVMQGPDERRVVIGVGVAGLRPELKGMSLDVSDRRRQELKRIDQYDALFEQVLALWSPNGKHSRGGFAEHSFDELEQPSSVDFNQYRERGVWLTVAFLTYFDSRDD